MIKPLMKICFLLPLCLAMTPANGQSRILTIEDCYRLARQNYPLIKQHQLITQSRDFNIRNLSTNNLPQFSIHGQMSYQSDVTHLPIHLPDVKVPELSKDHYKLYGEITQNLYDGGMTKAQEQMEDVQAKVHGQQLEVTLYKLRDRINQLFFGILLAGQQLKQNELLKKDIQLGLKKIKAAIENGIALKSNADILQAEFLKADQQTIELVANKNAFYKMLSMFIHQPVGDSIRLVAPADLSPADEITRPELTLFTYQNEMLDVKNRMLTAQILPKFNLFLQGGMGRPAMDMLDDRFRAYYIGGVNLSIPLSGLYTLKKKRALIDIGHQKIRSQQETFLFNTRLAVQQQDTEITKLRRLLSADDEIISRRQNIKLTALTQLQNGVINSNDYLKDVNAEDRARQNKILHQLQLLMTRYNRKTTVGNH